MPIGSIDISALALARRQCAFPLRIVRGFLSMLLVIGVGLAVVLVIVAAIVLSQGKFHELLQAWRELRVTQPGLEPNLVEGLSTVGALAFVVFRVSRGGRLVCLLLPALFLLLTVGACVTLAFDAVRGFPAFDFASLGPLLENSDVDYPLGAHGAEALRDPRVLPFACYSLLIYVGLLRVFWPMAKLALLPSLKAVRSRKRLVFAAPGDLRLLFRVVKNWSFRSFTLKPIGALLAYFLYLLCMGEALYEPFNAASETWRIERLHGYFDPSGAASIYGGSDTAGFIIFELICIAATVVVSVLLFSLSRLFLTATKRLAAMTAAKLRAIDKRPPVLYLRSFRNDALPAEAGNEGITRFFDPYRESGRLEELVVSRATAVGPVVAIGDPKTPIQLTGAARLWAADADWQDVVTALIAEAAAIVVVMDFTENLRWEIETLVRRAGLDRTIFVFPPPARQEGRAHATRMIEILEAAHIIGRGDAAAMTRPEDIRVLTVNGDEINILASSSATYSDYDVALRLILDDPARAKRRPGTAGAASAPAILASAPVA